MRDMSSRVRPPSELDPAVGLERLNSIERRDVQLHSHGKKKKNRRTVQEQKNNQIP